MSKWDLYKINDSSEEHIAESQNVIFEFDFPENETSENINYKVKYTDDDGCIGEIPFSVPYGESCHQTICTPRLEVTKSSKDDCCVNFKVKEPCQDIEEYDMIDWGYSTSSTDVNFTNGQAFNAKAATGATGIDQCPGILSSTRVYYVFWRNRNAKSVSGSSSVELAPCKNPDYNFPLYLEEPRNVPYDVGTFTYYITTRVPFFEEAEKCNTGDSIGGTITDKGFEISNKYTSVDCITTYKWQETVNINVPSTEDWEVSEMQPNTTYHLVAIENYLTSSKSIFDCGTFEVKDSDFTNTCEYDIVHLS